MMEQHWPWQVDRVLPSQHVAACQFQDDVLDALTALGWPEREIFGVRLALEEALANAIRHGNRGDPAKRVHVRAAASAGRLCITIRDQGTGFCPDNVPDCTAPENLEVPSGRGITLMRRFMTRVQYAADGTVVFMERVRADGESAAPPASPEAGGIGDSFGRDSSRD